jgi:hypothetical protein
LPNRRIKKRENVKERKQTEEEYRLQSDEFQTLGCKFRKNDGRDAT